MTTAADTTRLTDHDVAQIRGITDEWVRAHLAGDWDALSALHTDDIVFLPPEQPLVEGKAAVRAWLETFPPTTAFTATVVSAEGRPDFAWARGTFELTAEPEPGKPVTMRGKWAAHYRKRADGGWLCASDTWNLDAPLAAG